ncbi:MAG: hypothetical protein ACK559_34685, partial [bacterium]
TGGVTTGPQGALIDHPIRLGQRQHAKAMVIHAVAQVARLRVLLLDDHPQRFAHLPGVEPEVGVLTRGQERQQAEPRVPRSTVARRPIPRLLLLRRQELQTAVVH